MPANLLIVDDEPLVRKQLSQILKRKNYQLTLARDGREALALLEDHRFDLIVLDLMMPSLDGFDTLREIRNKGLTLPVIIMTAKAKEIEEQFVQFCIPDPDAPIRYVTKPVPADELLQKVELMLIQR